MATSPKIGLEEFSKTENDQYDDYNKSKMEERGYYVNPVFKGKVEDEESISRRMKGASDSYSVNDSLASDDLRSNKSAGERVDEAKAHSLFFGSGP